MRREDIRRQMTALVRGWEASGETQAVFAERQGVSQGKLRYWLQRATRPHAEPVSFTPVDVHHAWRPEAGTIEVSLATGERVVITDGASTDLVRAVVAGLRATC